MKISEGISHTGKKWWKECVIYQIYPRSFKDSNGDGIGDLQGILEKVNYLADLGIGAVWLNPVYDSPNDDMGYDIRDYEKIMAEFGTMEDFDRLLTALHARGIRLIMDLVVNHTSDEHAWFVESASSRDNKYRDFYIWRDGRQGAEPNNWASFFTPSAWKFDTTTGQWYLHLFSEKQPDLNWNNPQVRAEVYAMMNRWFDRGVDGFRMDVINLIGKDPALPDGTGEKRTGGYVFAPEYFAGRAEVHEWLQNMREACFDGRDTMCVGETPFVTREQAPQYIDPERNELDMLFQFELMDIDSGPSGKWEIVPWTLDKFKHIVSSWQQTTINGWNSLFWSNHDQPRPVSRFGSTETEELRIRSAKMLAVAMHLQRGTPFIYQGEEIGMTNTTFPDISTLRDIESLVFYTLTPDAEKPAAWEALLKKGRDNARTPMQWTCGKQAGFTDGTPWIMVNPAYPSINVEQDSSNPDSVLNFYKKLIKLRTANKTFIYGSYTDELFDHPQIFAYSRILDHETYTIMCNMTSDTATFTTPVSGGKIVLSNLPEESHPDSEMLLPFETRVLYRKEG
jgi:oligo-1,6-glucosidase